MDNLLAQAQVNQPYRIVELLQKDSLDLTETDRLSIRERIESEPNDKIVITHGTDTMTDTADALSGINKTIVMTGSLSPARFAMTDAMFNIGMAFAAAQALDRGVYIVMNGTLFEADSVIKNRAKNLFESKL